MSIDSFNSSSSDIASASDPRPAFARAVRTAVDVAAGIPLERFDDPTPCSEMNVRELLRHLHMVIARADAVGSPEVAAGTPLPLEDESIADGDLATAIASTAAAARSRWSDDHLLTEELALPWMTGSGNEVLAIYLNEVLVHAWDLAVASGQQPDWNDADADLSLTLIKMQLPVAQRDEMWAQARSELPEEFDLGWSDPFSDAVEVDAGSSPIERLVAWCGRNPAG